MHVVRGQHERTHRTNVVVVLVWKVRYKGVGTLLFCVWRGNFEFVEMIVPLVFATGKVRRYLLIADGNA